MLGRSLDPLQEVMDTSLPELWHSECAESFCLALNKGRS